MRKLLSILLCVLLALAFTACAGDAASPQNDPDNNDATRPTSDPAKSFQIVGLVFDTAAATNDYSVLQANFGDILTKEELKDLSKLYERTEIEETNVCIMKTMSDGTRLLLVLERLDAFWEEFTVKSVEILD